MAENDVLDDELNAILDMNLDGEIKTPSKTASSDNAAAKPSKPAEKSTKATKSVKSASKPTSKSTSKSTSKPAAKPAVKPAQSKKTDAKDEKVSTSGDSKPKRASIAGLSTSEALKVILGKEVGVMMRFDTEDKPKLTPTQLEHNFGVVDDLAKKEGAKVINLFRHLMTGSKLEVYTKTALELLIKDGKISPVSLREKYLAHPYSKGTSSSQTNQCMHIILGLKMALPEETGSRTLMINENSAILTLAKAQM